MGLVGTWRRRFGSAHWCPHPRWRGRCQRERRRWSHPCSTCQGTLEELFCVTFYPKKENYDTSTKTKVPVISFISEHFRSKVGRGPNNRLSETLFSNYTRKSKITQLDLKKKKITNWVDFHVIYSCWFNIVEYILVWQMWWINMKYILEYNNTITDTGTKTPMNFFTTDKYIFHQNIKIYQFLS